MEWAGYKFLFSSNCSKTETALNQNKSKSIIKTWGTHLLVNFLNHYVHPALLLLSHSQSFETTEWGEEIRYHGFQEKMIMVIRMRSISATRFCCVSSSDKSAGNCGGLTGPRSAPVWDMRHDCLLWGRLYGEEGLSWSDFVLHIEGAAATARGQQSLRKKMTKTESEGRQSKGS